MTFFYLFGIFIIAYTAYKCKALTKGATIVAIIIASFILLGFSLTGLTLLGLFFVTSTFVGNIRPRYSFQDDKNMIMKGNCRDIFQVLANGLFPAITAICYYFTLNAFWYYSFIAMIAAATSDTWASEIGKHSGKKPVHILTFKRISVGQSGGVSKLGTFAAFAGSFFIAFFAWVLQHFSPTPAVTISTMLAICFIGFLSQFVDTVVGATLQRLNRCTVCHSITEKMIHCGKKTNIVKGISWMTNDFVNHLCLLSAILFTYIYVSFIN